MDPSHNLMGSLDHVTASYTSTSPARPAHKVTAAHRADQLAAWVAFSLDEPPALKTLQDAAEELRDIPELPAVLPRVADAAMELLDAEFGNIQFVDPRDDSLVLVTQSGFGDEFLDHFAVVHDSHSVCGRAARQGAQAVTADVRDDQGLTPHQGVFRASGVRSVQSTPLVDHTGRLLGMISTHMSQPGRPSDQDLQIMELYGQLAGEVIARHLIVPDTAGHPHNGTVLDRRRPLLEQTASTNGVTQWVYRVDEPYGPGGCRTYGIHPDQWRGRITTDSPDHDAEYAAALVARDLRAEWNIHRTGEARPVHIHVWRGWEGTHQDAAFTMEIQPDLNGHRHRAVDPA